MYYAGGTPGFYAPGGIGRMSPEDKENFGSNRYGSKRSQKIMDRHFEKQGDVGAAVMTDYRDKRTGKIISTSSSQYQPKNSKRFQKVEPTIYNGDGSIQQQQEFGPSDKERLREKMKRRPNLRAKAKKFKQKGRMAGDIFNKNSAAKLRERRNQQGS